MFDIDINTPVIGGNYANRNNALSFCFPVQRDFVYEKYTYNMYYINV